jgi:membrane fusion protein (multidrug efflux system)
VALEQAEAALAQAVRQVRTLYANNGSLAAQVTLRQSDIARAQSDIAKAQDDLQRRRALSGNGAVSKEELNHAETSLANAKSALAAAQANALAAREQLTSNQSLTEGTSVEQHPSVQGRRRQGPRGLPRHAARRNAGAGRRLCRQAHRATRPARGRGHDDDVDRPAQPAVGRCQLQGSAVAQHPYRPAREAHGRPVRQEGGVRRRVAGLGVGTGAAFALLPAQNATGNWIKVVQRVPVRIALDPEQLKANPLRVGLSMDAEIDVSQKGGKMLADAPRDSALVQTQVYSKLDHGADAEVERIIAANLGHETPRKAPVTNPTNHGAPAASQAQPG